MLCPPALLAVCAEPAAAAETAEPAAEPAVPAEPAAEPAVLAADAEHAVFAVQLFQAADCAVPGAQTGHLEPDGAGDAVCAVPADE